MTRAGRHDEAAVIHGRVLELTCRDSTYLTVYADALAAIGKHKEAAAIGAEAVAACPDAAHLYFWYAGHLWQAGDHEAGFKAAREALDRDPNPDVAGR